MRAWSRWPLRSLLTPRAYNLSKRECQGHWWHARATFSALGSNSDQLCDLLLITEPFLLPVSSSITWGSWVEWCLGSPWHFCPLKHPPNHSVLGKWSWSWHLPFDEVHLQGEGFPRPKTMVDRGATELKSQLPVGSRAGDCGPRICSRETCGRKSIK